ncbi:MAG: hypothetical protein JXR49_19620 [Acidobacteria bacterium]|nr:hypothetical protein [Acidobacteriota bacterium]
MRTLAGFQVDRYMKVFKWPVAEALAAYEAKLKEDAQRAYMVDFIAWNIRAQAGSKERAPKIPDILKD